MVIVLRPSYIPVVPNILPTVVSRDISVGVGAKGLGAGVFLQGLGV